MTKLESIKKRTSKEGLSTTTRNDNWLLEELKIDYIDLRIHNPTCDVYPESGKCRVCGKICNVNRDSICIKCNPHENVSPLHKGEI